jgi:hypothetical protein
MVIHLLKISTNRKNAEAFMAANATLPSATAVPKPWQRCDKVLSDENQVGVKIYNADHWILQNTSLTAEARKLLKRTVSTQ